MHNKIACVSIATKNQEMLRGQYDLVKSYRTEPEHLIQTMAQEPLMFHLYKRRDFDSKSLKKLQTAEGKKA